MARGKKRRDGQATDTVEAIENNGSWIEDVDSQQIVVDPTQLNHVQIAALRDLGKRITETTGSTALKERDGKFVFTRYVFNYDNAMVDVEGMLRDTVRVNPPLAKRELGEDIDPAEVANRAKAYAEVLRFNREAIVDCLTQYETTLAAEDEFDRTLDLLENLDKNAEYFVKEIGTVVSFLPKNQPLYAFACFVLVPSLMAKTVSMRIPTAMKKLMPELLELLDYKDHFPNVEVSDEKREAYVKRVKDKADAVIFTGTMENADQLAEEFPPNTLFISNGAGHNPIVVGQRADVRAAVAAAIDVQFHNQGQDCAAPNAVLVHNDVLDDFVATLLTDLNKVGVGEYAREGVMVGPLTDSRGIGPVVDLVTANIGKVIAGGDIRLREGLVDPIVLVADGSESDSVQPYTELFGPVMKVVGYDSDEEMLRYFDDPRYAENAMYVTMFGDLPNFDRRVRRGWYLHPENTIVRNTHLHADGVERGIQPYGGYGPGASSIRYAGYTIPMPTLPQRDIFRYLVQPSLEDGVNVGQMLPHQVETILNANVMSVKTNRITSREIARAPEWSEYVAQKVLDTFPDQELYTVAAGISPSGVVHFGNLRDVMTSLSVAKALKDKGKDVRFLFSWDDFDRFRKVPKGLAYHLNMAIDPKIYEYASDAEALKAYEGMPIQEIPYELHKIAIEAYDEWFRVEYGQYDGCCLSQIPDPKGELGSYAERFEAEFQASMAEMGIDLQYVRQSEVYPSGAYADGIKEALQKRHQIGSILYSFMSDKAKDRKGLVQDEYVDNYWPIAVYSRFTGKDNTEVLDYDGEYGITYKCLDTGNEETVDLRESDNVKLQWKIDWAMRWAHEQVHFEPGGKDHASPNGSYDTSAVIAEHVYGRQAPVFVGYDFIGLSGLDGKMSSSAGNAVSPGQLLSIYTPELLSWIYNRTAPNGTFKLAFDSEVYRLYSEFDKTFEVEGSVQFRQLVGYGQSVDWDADRVCELLKLSGEEFDEKLVHERLPKAKAWAETYNREALTVLNSQPNTEYFAQLDDERKENIAKLVEYLRAHNIDDLEALNSAVYAIPKRDLDAEEVTKEDKDRQKAFFKDIYQLLFSQDRGPRLATYVWAVGTEQLIDLLDL